MQQSIRWHSSLFGFPQAVDGNYCGRLRRRVLRGVDAMRVIYITPVRSDLCNVAMNIGSGGRGTLSSNITRAQSPRSISKGLANFGLRTIRRLCVICVSVLTASCYYLPPEIVPVHPDPPPGRFLGITELAPGSNHMRILFIHGIGVHPGCDPDTLLLHLTKALGVTQQPPPAIDPSETCAHFALPKPTPIPAPNALDTGLLYRFDLASRDLQVTFMYLRWSTLTAVPKATLDEPNRPPGALLHNVAKSFEQENLADVVLYGGQYRDVLRPVVERALCVFVGGIAYDPTNPRLCSGGEAEIPTAIITHSLAGYMLMDAMADIYHPPPPQTVSKEHSAAVKVGHYLDQIFMLANQLKMLDLSTRTSEVQPPSGRKKVPRSLGRHSFDAAPHCARAIFAPGPRD
jgi:hypothetical protein